MLERYSHWFGMEWFVSDRPISLLVVAWLAGTGCNWMQPVIPKGIILMVTHILIFTVKKSLATGIQTPCRRNSLSRVCCQILCSKTRTWLQSHWSKGCSRRQDIFSYRTVTLEWLMRVLSWSFEHEEGFWVARTMKGTNTLCWLCLWWPVFCMQSAAEIMIIIRSDEGVTLLKAPWQSSVHLEIPYTAFRLNLAHQHKNTGQPTLAPHLGMFTMLAVAGLTSHWDGYSRFFLPLIHLYTLTENQGGGK